MNIFEIFSVCGNREDLLDIIYLILLVDMLFIGLIVEIDVMVILYEWQIDVLVDVMVDNVQFEGDNIMVDVMVVIVWLINNI